MKKATGYSQSRQQVDSNQISPLMRESIQQVSGRNIRQCPSCGLLSLAEMPGGRDATCKNCGYKDPCCND